MRRELECPREAELLQALQTSRPRQTRDGSLSSHVGSCHSCAELLEIAGALLDDERALVREADVPSSAIVWWRAQMRVRREAVEQASQPISVVQGMGLACAAGLVATLLGLFVPTFRKSLSWISGLDLALPAISAAAVAESLTDPIAIAALLALGLCALVLPVALYFALHD